MKGRIYMALIHCTVHRMVVMPSNEMEIVIRSKVTFAQFNDMNYFQNKTKILECLIFIRCFSHLSSAPQVLSHLTVTSLEDRQNYYILEMSSYDSQKTSTSPKPTSCWENRNGDLEHPSRAIPPSLQQAYCMVREELSPFQSRDTHYFLPWLWWFLPPCPEDCHQPWAVLTW
jgi:hypothetical protein